MGMTGAVGQIILNSNSKDMRGVLQISHLEMVRSYGVEKSSPTMTSISQAMQEDHGSCLLDSGFENYWFQGHFQI